MFSEHGKIELFEFIATILKHKDRLKHFYINLFCRNHSFATHSSPVVYTDRFLTQCKFQAFRMSSATVVHGIKSGYAIIHFSVLYHNSGVSSDAHESILLHRRNYHTRILFGILKFPDSSHATTCTLYCRSFSHTVSMS